MIRNSLHQQVRNNLRWRIYPVTRKSYGRFRAGPLFPNYGTRMIISNRLRDRFSTDNIHRRIYRYSRRH